MSAKKVKIGSFLTERKTRYKPDEANELGLRRVNKIDFSGTIHLVEHKPTRTNMILVKKGDLLISGINAEKGGVAVYEYEEDAIATIHYSSYLYDAKKIEVEYLKWFLKSNTFKNILIEQAGSGIKSELKPNRFLPLEIDLPTLSEQKGILQKLESVNSEIEELHEIVEQNEKLISKLRQSILQDAVQGKLTEGWRKQNPNVESAAELLKRIAVEKEQLTTGKKIKKEKPLPTIKKGEIPFELPSNWKWCKLGDVIKEKPRNGFSPKGVDFITETKSLKLGATTKGVFNPAEVKYLNVTIPKDSYLWLEEGDILIQRSNSIDYVGVSAVYRGDKYDYVYPDLMMKIQAVLNPMTDFLYFVLSSQMTRKYYRENASGTSGNMPKINQGVVLNTLVPVAPMVEQKHIIEKVEMLNNYCNTIENEIISSKANAELLMQTVLSDLLGEEKNLRHDKTSNIETKITPIRKSKYDSKTTYMELVKLLQEHGKLHAEELWKMSEFPNDIDEFYAELKKQIEEEKTIKEAEKGYLELA